MRPTRRGLANTTLLAAAVALSWVLWARPKPQAAAPPPLAPIQSSAITTITIMRPGRPTIRLRRIGRHWRLVEPFKARAARFRVEAITDIVDSTPRDHFTPPKGPLSAFGLAPPRAVVILNTRRILIGRRRPFGDLRYILTGGDIALVPAEVIHPRELTSDSFLSTRLLGHGMHPVAFTLPHLTVSRHDGIWRAAPSEAHISNDRINGFVDAWRYARALSVSRYHGAPVVGRVVIAYHTRGAHKVRVAHTLAIDILARHPELVLLRPDQGLEYHFPQEIGKRLLAIGPRARTP
ncbi:hypothetical protein [Acidiferrobacter sp.]|uniref:hypothetical protein n=1 Tax=Acidiferrobacter sp. TaxID=1872107 RepID=UPI002632E39E|nr:hypothetical protein [Acidiferrobacter sp.]